MEISHSLQTLQYLIYARIILNISVRMCHDVGISDCEKCVIVDCCRVFVMLAAHHTLTTRFCVLCIHYIRIICRSSSSCHSCIVDVVCVLALKSMATPSGTARNTHARAHAHIYIYIHTIGVQMVHASTETQRPIQLTESVAK